MQFDLEDTSIGTALELDANDELASFREAFAIPRQDNGEPAHYLCGHSLGLMPRAAVAAVNQELERWSTRGVAGHFDEHGWFAYHERFAAPLARLLGAESREVIAMNSLTVNLHLMLVSFFQPDGPRRRILIESGAFPSDRFAVQSQLRFHGFDPNADLVELSFGSDGISAAALDAALTGQNQRVALVLLPGVQYLTGEAIDLKACAEVARRHGCLIGFDLAHAIGNLALDLRLSEPDFAVWCSYKYLNAGPGAIGGCFVNRRWLGTARLDRFEGWWGQDQRFRFDAGAAFQPCATAEAWQLSNPPVLAMAPLQAALELFSTAGMPRLRAKSIALTGYLQALLAQLCGDKLNQLTPLDPNARGAQLSLQINDSPAASAGIIAALRARGLIADWRAPDTLRLAPAPLYNSFADVHAAATILAEAV